MNQETALVLSGGGAKGMYHIGAWQALRELEISIDAVIGNSAGALMAGFIAQGDFETARDVVENLDISKVVDIPPDLLDKGQFTINESNLVKLSKMQKNFFKEKGLDTAPLKKLLEKNLKEETIRNSGLDLGIVTFQLNKLKAREIFLEDMEEGQVLNYLLASATVPGFKLTKIGENSFIDGGVYNNVPVDMARARGYRRIIVIDIAGIGVTKKFDIEDCTITYVKNKSDVGGLLDFRKEAVEKLRDLGYRDTMKVFGKIEGLDYYIWKDEEIPESLEKLWLKDPDGFIPEEMWRETDEENGITLMNRLYQALPWDKKNIRRKIPMLAECAALTLNVDREKIYKWEEFLEVILTRYEEVKQEVWTIMENLSEGAPPQRMKKAVELTVDFQKHQKEKKYKYFLLSKEIREAFPLVPVTQLENNYPELNVSRVFFNLLQKWKDQQEK